MVERTDITSPAADPESAGPVLTVPGAPLAFHLMAKPTGAICNLDCEYCFFLSKEMLYPGSRFRMAAEIHETYIRQLLEAHPDHHEVVVAWQGGEPTMMGLDFFRRSIELEQRYAKPGQRILNTMQTNGTLARRRVGRLPEGARLPRRHLDRRPRRDARRLPRGQGRQAHLRPGDGGPRRAQAPRGRLERAHDDPRRERRSRPRGLHVLPRRARCHVHPVHPDHRAGDRGELSPSRRRGGARA